MSRYEKAALPAIRIFVRSAGGFSGPAPSPSAGWGSLAALWGRSGRPHGGILAGGDSLASSRGARGEGAGLISAAHSAQAGEGAGPPLVEKGGRGALRGALGTLRGRGYACGGACLAGGAPDAPCGAWQCLRAGLPMTCGPPLSAAGRMIHGTRLPCGGCLLAPAPDDPCGLPAGLSPLSGHFPLADPCRAFSGAFCGRGNACGRCSR